MSTLTTHANTQTNRQARLSREAAWLAVAACLVMVSIGLRSWRLGSLPGVNGDEAWSGVQAVRLVQGEPIAWRTPTGNPINVFFLLPLAALHAVFPPSFGLLRLVSLASGLVALAVNYWLCRRAFDSRTAVVSTVLLAVLPINIAYSRFAWDASQSLLATLPVVYLPLIALKDQRGGLSVGGMLALAAAIVVHPTNVFAAPLLVIPVVYARRTQWLGYLREAAIPARAWAFPALALCGVGLAWVAWLAMSRAAALPRGPQELSAFVRYFLMLFSGSTVFEYIAGTSNSVGVARLAPAIADVLFLGVTVAAAIGIARRPGRKAHDGDLPLLLGWASVVLGFFVVAGPRAIAPHFERYAVVLVAPTAVVLARGLSFWIEPERARGDRGRLALAAAAGLWLALFAIGYTALVARTGGESHRAFRTAAVEPKLAAFRHVLDRRDPAVPAVIVTREWWSYWPLAYLASGHDGIRVELVLEEPSPDKPLRTEPTWFVDFVDETHASDATHRPLAAGQSAGVFTIQDASGRKLLEVRGPAAEKF